MYRDIGQLTFQKTITMRKLIIILITMICFNSCKTQNIEYQISDSYIGPALVFIYPDNTYLMKGFDVIIKDGLGAIDDNKMKRKFIFKSIESKTEIKIINIGSEEKISDNSRYIFQLTKDTHYDICNEKILNVATFFVGRKLDYAKWSDKHINEFSFFDSTGVDLCKYYKSNLKNTR